VTAVETPAQKMASKNDYSLPPLQPKSGSPTVSTGKSVQSTASANDCLLPPLQSKSGSPSALPDKGSFPNTGCSTTVKNWGGRDLSYDVVE